MSLNFCSSFLINTHFLLGKKGIIRSETVEKFFFSLHSLALELSTKISLITCPNFIFFIIHWLSMLFYSIFYFNYPFLLCYKQWKIFFKIFSFSWKKNFFPFCVLTKCTYIFFFSSTESCADAVAMSRWKFNDFPSRMS